MRGVKKKSLRKKVFFNFFIKLCCYNSLDFFFGFNNSLSNKFFFFLNFQFFLLQAYSTFVNLNIYLNNDFLKKNFKQYLINNYSDDVFDDTADSSIDDLFKQDLLLNIVDTQILEKWQSTKYFPDDSDESSAEDTALITQAKAVKSFFNIDFFLYKYAYRNILTHSVIPNIFDCVVKKNFFYFNYLLSINLKFINFSNAFFLKMLFFFKKITFKFLNLTFNIFFFKKEFTICSIEKKKKLPVKKSKKRPKFHLMYDQNQFFLEKHFNIFSNFFFLNFMLSGIKFNITNNISQKILGALLFLPDNFLFLNYSGFFIKDKKYNNILPLFNISLNLRFRQKKSLPLKNTNVFLWYLLNFFENKLQKPVFLKLLYSRKAISKKSIYLFSMKVFRRLKRYTFKFKRNFFLGEIIRITTISLMSRDSTLFINYITWVLMQIPYKDVKGFLYFLKVFLKKCMLPFFKSYFFLKGFVFDIRGKVGVTGDAKKRHTLISWGQSSFSEKNLKLSLKQGLVYTRTGVMGVTVIIIF